jgi:hypothetical protein
VAPGAVPEEVPVAVQAVLRVSADRMEKVVPVAVRLALRASADRMAEVPVAAQGATARLVQVVVVAGTREPPDQPAPEGRAEQAVWQAVEPLQAPRANARR